MDPLGILFDREGRAKSRVEIISKIQAFGDSYNDVTKEIIDASKRLDPDGKVFSHCAARILSNFRMTRSGPFHQDKNARLRACWNAVGASLIDIYQSVRNSGLPRDRFLVEISQPEREELIAEIWRITKKLLPFTMGQFSYGLVGASKILFSVLPEIVLPVDNAEWLYVFKTVDLGDVLHRMVFDIQAWEGVTGMRLNELDPSCRLTTLPSVYNVMAMDAKYRK